MGLLLASWDEAHGAGGLVVGCVWGSAGGADLWAEVRPQVIYSGYIDGARGDSRTV